LKYLVERPDREEQKKKVLIQTEGGELEVLSPTTKGRLNIAGSEIDAPSKADAGDDLSSIASQSGLALWQK